MNLTEILKRHKTIVITSIVAGILATSCSDKMYDEPIIKCDSHGNEIERLDKRDYDSDGKVDYISKTIYNYDDEGELIEIITKEDENGDGKIDHRTRDSKFVYDSNRELIEYLRQTSLDGDENYEFVEIRTYY